MRKPTKQALDEHAPWKPAVYDDAVAHAFKALALGAASLHQQKLALEWLVRDCCRTYDLSYRPGEEGQRDTDFAEGMRHVGLQIVKLLNVKIGSLKRGTEQ